MSRRTNWTRAAVLGLTACLLLGLCACAGKNNAQDASDDDSYANLTRKIEIGAHREAPDDEPDSAPDSTPAAPETSRPGASPKPVRRNTAPKDPAGGADGDAASSLAATREEMSGSQQTFACAYLGYYDGTGGALADWMRERNPRLLERCPFIASIPEERVIGSAGHLFCVIPRDPMASVAANRVSLTGQGTYTVDEICYRAESGEPILLFTNRDSDPMANVDTVVLVTPDSGDPAEWYPQLDMYDFMRPCTDASGTARMLDISEYVLRGDYSTVYGGGEYVGGGGSSGGSSEFDALLSLGYLGPMSGTFAGTDINHGLTWTATGPVWGGGEAEFFLSLDCNALEQYDGSATLDWRYAGQTEMEEQWSGWWQMSLEMEKPSRVTFSLTRVGGRNYDTADGPMYISGTYPVLISPSGEELVFAADKDGVSLPFLPEGAAMATLYLSYE